ncbi:MAG: helix-turn-helix domain-containing protein [Aequoribacter sp.]|jgi:Fis family transcriptional regulator|uniref:Putative Fis-like DNA-binding protein n=1 Tax=Aequoribacter fuscus TaxID=2518989 RepID=F3L060_9GAMM|nr:helix-turn-helix domain-containing protein [Aequoribacter fuscus]EGG30273.1 DNA-binding protein Fis [Aequoribacter fuscus]QHJ86904.1 Fis family transcriptional regulator [Aequoribacter fuscus]
MSLRNAVTASLDTYFEQMDGQLPSDLYTMVINEVEGPLLAYVMEQVNHNQCKAAEMLGLNRGTLRKKLKFHQLID